MSPDAVHGIDVLSAVDGAWDHLVVGTYNADLQFFEYAVLPRTSGVRNAVVVIDEEMLDESFEMLTHGQSLRRVNSRYLAAPCRAIGASHAKWILLAADDRARLMIGSGNLTYSGYARDVELFTRFDIDRERQDNAQAFTAVRSLLRHLIQDRRLPDRAAAQIELVWKTLHWIPDDNSPSPTRVLHNATEPLADQFIDAVPEVDRLTIYAPFWDHTCSALEQLVAELRPGAVRVLLQPGLTTVDALQLERVLGAVDGPTETVPVDTTRGLIHAKLLAAEHHGQVTLLAGSPNASAAALSRPTASGNIELATVTELEKGAFDQLIANLEPRAPQPATTMSLRAPRPTEEDAEPQNHLRISNATWDGASLDLNLMGPPLDGEIEITVGGHGPWTITAESGTATLSPDLPTKERLEAGSWVRVRPNPTDPWSAPTCPVRTHHLEHQLEAAPGRQAALRRVITGHPEISDDLASLLAELERSLLLTPHAIRKLAAPSKTTQVDTSGHDTFDDLETLWASLSAHANVLQYSELDLQTETAGPPSDLAVLLAALGARLPQPLRETAQAAILEVDDERDRDDLADELIDDEHESEDERAIRLADEAEEREKQRANARRHYRRFFGRACAAYEATAFRELLTPQMVAAQVVVLTDLTSQLITENLATTNDANEWLARLWNAVFKDTSSESDSAPDATELREHLIARGWTASFVVTLTRIAERSGLPPSATVLAPLRAAAHHVIAHDSCPPLSADALDTLATEIDATGDEAWTRINDFLSGLSQDEIRRDLAHFAGLVEHSAAFQRVQVRRGGPWEQPVQQLELPASPATADEDLVIKLIARWTVLDPACDYYRVFVPATENTPKVVAVYDRTAEEDAWIASDGHDRAFVELPGQRPAWRHWLDKARPTGS